MAILTAGAKPGHLLAALSLDYRLRYTSDPAPLSQGCSPELDFCLVSPLSSAPLSFPCSLSCFKCPHKILVWNVVFSKV